MQAGAELDEPAPWLRRRVRALLGESFEAFADQLAAAIVCGGLAGLADSTTSQPPGSGEFDGILEDLRGRNWQLKQAVEMMMHLRVRVQLLSR